MKKLTLAHAEAVSAAKLSLCRQLDMHNSPDFNQLIKGHFDLMSEVYWWVLHMIYNPELEFDDKALEKDIEAFHKDHSHRTTPKPDRT